MGSLKRFITQRVSDIHSLIIASEHLKRMHFYLAKLIIKFRSMTRVIVGLYKLINTAVPVN